MTLAMITFALTLSMVLGSYWLLVVRPEAQTTGRLRKRIQIKADRPVGAGSIVKGSTAAGGQRGLFAAVTEWHRQYAVVAAGRLLESAGMRTDPRWLIGGTAIAFFIIETTLQVADAPWQARLAAAATTPLIPYFYIRRAAKQRLHQFEEMFPDAINLMSRALRAGHAVTTTLAMVAEEVPDPVRTEFRVLREQHNFGMPMTDVLRTFANRIPLIDVRFFATAVLTQRETGGNLAEVLDNLGNVMRERFRMRRQMKVLTAQARMTGWVLAALPLLLGVILFALRPDQMHEFLADPIGWRLFESAIVLEIIGALAIRKILEVDL
jgi:tight adherence protein B